MLAATQRPLGTSALGQASRRAQHTEIRAPHLSMISSPRVVASVIIKAARAAGRPRRQH
jgi:membrane protein required for beta-lactamase induction